MSRRSAPSPMLTPDPYAVVPDRMAVKAVPRIRLMPCSALRSPTAHSTANVTTPAIPRTATDQPSHCRTPSTARACSTLAAILAWPSIGTSEPWLTWTDERVALPAEFFPPALRLNPATRAPVVAGGCGPGLPALLWRNGTARYRPSGFLGSAGVHAADLRAAAAGSRVRRLLQRGSARRRACRARPATAGAPGQPASGRAGGGADGRRDGLLLLFHLHSHRDKWPARPGCSRARCACRRPGGPGRPGDGVGGAGNCHGLTPTSRPPGPGQRREADRPGMPVLQDRQIDDGDPSPLGQGQAPLCE